MRDTKKDTDKIPELKGTPGDFSSILSNAFTADFS